MYVAARHHVVSVFQLTEKEGKASEHINQCH